MTSSSSQTPEAAETSARVEAILGELKSRFKASVLALKSAIAAYVHDGTLPPADAASTGLFDYPALRLVTDGVRREGQGHNLAFGRSEEHTSELQSLMRISYAVFCLKKKKHYTSRHTNYVLRSV